MRAGETKSVVTRVQPSEIISNSPMLAVPGWLESQSVPKPEAVVAALKITARVSAVCRKGCAPARQATTN